MRGRASASTSRTTRSWWSAWPREWRSSSRSKRPRARTVRLKRAIALAAEGGRHIVGAVNMKSFKIDPVVLDERTARCAARTRPSLPKDGDSHPQGRCLRVRSRRGRRGFARLTFAATTRTTRTRRKPRRAFARPPKSAESISASSRRSWRNHWRALRGRRSRVRSNNFPRRSCPTPVSAGINTLDELLANPPLKREGSEVVLSADSATMINAIYGGYAAAFGMLFDAVVQGPRGRRPNAGKQQPQADRPGDAQLRRPMGMLPAAGSRNGRRTASPD